MAGIVKKLFIREGYRITIQNAPSTFALPQDELPAGLEVASELSREFDLVLLFVLSKEEIEKYVPDILSRLKEDAKLWIAYPKKSSKVKTNISRDNGWEILEKNGYEGVGIVAIDDTWSALRFRPSKYVRRQRN